MKNPFNTPVRAAKHPQHDHAWHVVWKLAHMSRSSSLMSQEQAEYAAHAINQHDKLVAAVKAYQDLCTCYRIGKQPTEKLFGRLDDAKAALLDEEETP